MIAFRKDFEQPFSRDIHEMFGEGGLLSGAKSFRVPARTTANGRCGGRGAGRKSSSRRRSRNRRRQVIGLSRTGCSLCVGTQTQSDHFDPHHQSPGAIAAKGHPDCSPIAGSTIRGRIAQRKAKLSLSKSAGARSAIAKRPVQQLGATRVASNQGMEPEDNRRHPERYRRRSGPFRLGASLQRTAHLHSENMRATVAAFTRKRGRSY